MKERLQILADMVSEVRCIADIGTDHGFLPIELVRTGKAHFAIAMDIASGPLERAKAHICEAGLSDRIECRLSDGFDKLDPQEADAAVIAGMGGDLMADIISRKPYAVRELILSPHSHPEKVRAVLRICGYCIREERMIADDNKYYVFIKAVRTSDRSCDRVSDRSGDRVSDRPGDRVSDGSDERAGGRSDDGTTDIAEVDHSTGHDRQLRHAHSSTEEVLADEAVQIIEDHFGPQLIKNKDRILRQYLLKEIEKFHDIEQKKEYLSIVEMALTAMR